MRGILFRTYFSLIEMLVVMALLSLLASLLTGTFKRIGSQAQHLECQNKLKNYAIAYSYYLEENNNVFPAKIRYGVLSSQTHWHMIRGMYPEIFPTRESYTCSTFDEIWGRDHYRGYTGISLKRFEDLQRNPTKVGLIGDGIKSNTVNGYPYFTISGISEISLNKMIGERRSRSFHFDDFIHFERQVNTEFVDGHVEALEPYELLFRKDDIWNR